ncbi:MULTISPECIES: MspA family porin [unclassified Gordonia (in: high G+C Gram-positive bacteria)]
MKKIITRRVAAVVGIAGAAVMGLGSFGVGGAHAGPVAGGKVTKKLADGTPVTVALYDQFINIQHPVSNVPTSREVWASGKVNVTVGGKAEGGSIKAGYLVGCQVNFGIDDSSGAGAGFTNQGTWGDFNGVPYPRFNKNNGQASPVPGANGGVTLQPGAVSTVWLINTTSGDSTAYKDYGVNDYTFKGSSGGVQYSQEQFGVDGCAGYASAQPIVQVSVSTDSVKSLVTLRGTPFSLG